MARPIGAGATGVPIDYSAWADSAWRLGAANAGAFNSVANAVTGILEDRKVKKDQIKVSADLLKAYATINPERADTFNQIAEQLKDEERPLSERATFAEQVGSLVSMDQDRQKSDRQIAQFAQSYALDLQRANLAEDAGRFELGTAKEDRDLAKQSLADDKEIQSFVAPQILNQVLKQTAAMEQAGQPVFLSSSQLQQALNAADPSQQMKIAGMAMSMLQKEPPEFRDIEVTIDGQPGKATAAYNRKTGTFDIVPVRQAGSAPSGLGNYPPESGVFRAPTTHYSQGSAVGGPDEMQDKWTNKGYSSTGKNLAPGVVAVNEEAYKLGTVFQDADTGETFIAADRHGNKNPSVIDIYQPPGEYTKSSKPRNLRVIGFEENIGKSPQEIASQRAKWAEVASQYITPGAAKSAATPKTQTEQAIDEARLSNLQAQAKNREADLAKQTDAKATAKASAQDALKLVSDLRKHPGLSSAVGVSLTPGFIPATDRKGAEAIVNQLKGHAFLTAIQQLRGLGALSDAEGQKVQQAAARLDASQSEKDFNKSLDDFENQIREALGRLGGASAPQSASDRLRSRINAQ